MNMIARRLSVTMMAVCFAGSAQEPGPSQPAFSATPLPPGKSAAEKSSTLAERVKFGYESYGIGRRLNPTLHLTSDQQLRCMARTGDAGAAQAYWSRLADFGDAELTRMPEAEEIALEQYRLIGHTFLIYMTAGRYKSAAEDESYCQFWCTRV